MTLERSSLSLLVDEVGSISDSRGHGLMLGQEGKLYILQCRSGKRTAKASVKMAVDMYKEKLISRKEVHIHARLCWQSPLLHRQPHHAC